MIKAQFKVVMIKAVTVQGSYYVYWCITYELTILYIIVIINIYIDTWFTNVKDGTSQLAYITLCIAMLYCCQFMLCTIHCIFIA